MIQPTPIIGIYGKMGAVKGTFDILAALTRLKREGFRFTLLAATHGSADDEARFARAVAAGDLTDRVRQVPFLPISAVPSFLRACSLGVRAGTRSFQSRRTHRARRSRSSRVARRWSFPRRSLGSRPSLPASFTAAMC